MPLIGITGGVASGKSTFTRQLAAALGTAAFDADACVRDLLGADPAVRAEVRAAFGPEIFDEQGAVRRDALRAIVFGDPERRRALEGILHPRVRRGWQDWAQERLQTDPNAFLLVEIPLLYETRAEVFFARVLLVACTPATQERRLVTRRGLTAETARQIIASQLDLASKMARADHVIWNEDGAPTVLEAQTTRCAGWLRAGFGSVAA